MQVFHLLTIVPADTRREKLNPVERPVRDTGAISSLNWFLQRLVNRSKISNARLEGKLLLIDKQSSDTQCFKRRLSMQGSYRHQIRTKELFTVSASRLTLEHSRAGHLACHFAAPSGRTAEEMQRWDNTSALANHES